jgi:hypothetical protein
VQYPILSGVREQKTMAIITQDSFIPREAARYFATNYRPKLERCNFRRSTRPGRCRPRFAGCMTFCVAQRDLHFSVTQHQTYLGQIRQRHRRHYAVVLQFHRCAESFRSVSRYDSRFFAVQIRIRMCEFYWFSLSLSYNSSNYKIGIFVIKVSRIINKSLARQFFHIRDTRSGVAFAYASDVAKQSATSENVYETVSPRENVALTFSYAFLAKTLSKTSLNE